MAEQSLKEKTAKGLFWGGLSNGVQQLLNLIFGLVLSRILDAEDYGMVGMLAIFTAIVSTIQESGFTAALTNKEEIRDEDYNAVFWFSSLVGVFFYIILFFLSPLIADFYGKPDLVVLSRVLFVGFLFGGVATAPSAYLFKTLMVKQRAKIEITSLLCSGSMGLVLAINDFAYYGLALQTVTYIGVGALLKLCLSPWKPSLKIDFKPLRQMIGFSSNLLFVNFLKQIGDNIFSVILGKMYTASLVGFYSQGYKWMGMGYSQILGTISNVAQPVFSQVRNEVSREIQVLRKMFRFGAFISFPLMLGLALVSREFIIITIGEKWLESVPFLQMFCVWGAFAYMGYLYTNILITHGKSDVFFKGNLAVLSAQLFVAFVFSYWGIFYMISAYICVNILSIFMWHLCVSRYIELSMFSILKDIGPYLVITIVGIGLSWCTSVYLFQNTTALFLYKGITFSLIYISALWFLDSKILKECLTFLTGRKNDKV